MSSQQIYYGIYKEDPAKIARRIPRPKTPIRTFDNNSQFCRIEVKEKTENKDKNNSNFK